MAGSFTTAKGPDGLNGLNKILGPSYDYTGHIKTPSEMAQQIFKILAAILILPAAGQ